MEETKIEFEIINLMQELQTVYKDIENVTTEYVDAIVNCKAIIEENLKKQEEASAPFVKKSEELQEKIKQLVILRGKSLKTGSGTTTYVKGKEKIEWDMEMLERAYLLDDEVKSRIGYMRKEIPAKPSARIKINIKGTSMTEI